MVKPKFMNLYEVGGNPEASPPPPPQTIWLAITKIPRFQLYHGYPNKSNSIIYYIYGQNKEVK